MRAQQEILEFMRSKAYRPLTFKELAKEFNLASHDLRPFQVILADLEKDGLIIKTRKDRYGIPERMNLIVGRLQGHRNGFGFIIADDSTIEDIYVALENMNGAMHNDRVIARPYKKHRSEGKVEGEIIRIISRANEKVVGRMEKARHLGFVVPDNHRLFYDIFIPANRQMGAKEGDIVVAKIEKWPAARRNPEGKIIEILGSPDEPGIDIESLIYRLDLPRNFSRAALKEADLLPEGISEEQMANRLDLRDKLIFTIDGEDAKDFDDAISLEPLEGPWQRLGVHIADVAEYVKENSPLDKEGRQRGTSIYLVDRAIPMLPERLSDNLCSLQPHKDRLTLTVFMEIHKKTGEMRTYDICETVIKSKRRLTYTEVNGFLKGGKGPDDKDLAGTLQEMAGLAKVLKRARSQKGSIDFDLPEPFIDLAEDGTPLAIIKKERGPGETLIEEFMVITNETIAEYFCYREMPFIYRIHEVPDSDDMQELKEYLANLGYYVKEKDGKVESKALQVVLEQAKGRPEEKLIQMVVLRSLKQARYHWMNLGHFGLASKYYTHFTSPIRRYPDLVAHRILKETLDLGSLSKTRLDQLEGQLPIISRHSSEMERRAMEAERESVDIKMVEYMANQVGREFNGHISSVLPFGLFVELDNLVEGLVHVSSLTDDFYHYQEKKHLLLGERKRKIYRLGDPVKIKVDKVNKTLSEIDFVLVEDC